MKITEESISNPVKNNEENLDEEYILTEESIIKDKHKENLLRKATNFLYD